MNIPKRFVYIDSSRRTSGTNSRFKYNLNVNNFTDYDSVCVLQANIPKSFYLVESGENTFTLTESASTVTITSPAGNYTRHNLKTVVEGLLNTGSPHSYTYAIAIPASTSGDDGHYTFTVSGNAGVQPVFTFGVYIAGLLGFNPNSTNTFVANTLESVNVCKLQLEDSVFIHSSLVNNGNDDILQDVFASSDPSFSNIVWQCPQIDAFSKKIRYYERDAEFYITDEAGQEMDLQGLNVVFTILLYKSENIAELLKKYIKFSLLQNS